MPYATVAELAKMYGLSRPAADRIAGTLPPKARQGSRADVDQFALAAERHAQKPHVADQRLRPAIVADRAGAVGADGRKSAPERDPLFMLDEMLGLNAPPATPPADEMTALRLAKARADAARTRASATKAELAARAAAGELVSREAVTTLGARVLTEIRLRLEALPSRLGSDLEGLDAAGIEARLAAEVKQTLADLSRLNTIGEDDDA